MDKKLIAAAAGCVGYGALVAWAITSDYYERKLRDKEAYIAFLRNWPIGKITSVVETDEGVEATGVLFDDTEISPEEDTSDDNVTGDEDDEDVIPPGETPATTRENLQKIIDQYTADPEEAERFADAGIRMNGDNAPPFVISREKYAWDEDEGDNYDKITITYYPQFRVMLDEDNELMEDVANVIGWRNLAQFGGESGDPDVVFVRNRRMMTDFEVVRDEEGDLPLHIKYGMGREEFEVNKAAGTIRLRDEDT
jgi:hypothetical protein